ncbi:MAG: 6,7-dimethyl-8-ribityllumazine synthase [Deltaproteobacteria bacterium]|nr:6,7-dimethyl-8-ribityllumazine synthase [Deltaproteobacteria bacterium]
MPKVIEGKLNAAELKFGIVVSRFNSFISERLVEGAVDALVRNGAKDGDITIAKVPGAFEIPATARILSGKGYDAIICLGAVIRGSTPHFDYVASEVSKGVAQVSMDSKIPIIFGVLTTDNIEQAIERAGTKSGNKGWDAAVTAIEMVNLYRELGSKPSRRGRKPKAAGEA